MGFTRSLKSTVGAVGGTVAALLLSPLAAAGAVEADSIDWGLPASDVSGEGAYAPSVAAGADGTMAVAWLAGTGIDAQNDTHIEVAVKAAGASGFSAPVTVSAAGEEVNHPRVAVSAAGAVTVAWQRYASGNTPTRIEYATRGAGASSFAAEGVVGTCDAGSGLQCGVPLPAYGPSGDTTVAWGEDDGFAVTYRVKAATRVAGASSFVAVGGSVGDEIADPAAPSDIAYLPDSSVVLLAATLDTVGSTMKVVTRAAGAEKFAAPETVSGADMDWPELAVSDDGAVAVVWTLSSAEAELGNPQLVQVATKAKGATNFAAAKDVGVGYAPVASYGPDGSLTVASISGTQFSGASSVVDVRTRAAGAADFGAAAQVSSSGGQIPWLDLATAADGTTMAVWRRTAGGVATVQAATRPANSTTFAAPQDLTSAGQVGSCFFDNGGIDWDGMCGPHVVFSPTSVPSVVWGTQPSKLFSGLPITVGRIQLATKAVPTPVTPPTAAPPTTAPPTTAPPTTAPPASEPIAERKASLKVKALGKKKKLKVGKATKVVRKVTTNANIAKVQVRCSQSGKKLKGKASKRLCGIKANKKRGRVMVKPVCSTGLKYTAKITANGQGVTKNTWKRTWQVKSKPRVACS
jgi:hypothetical protein